MAYKDPAAKRAQARAWYLKNRDAVLAKSAAYKAANPGVGKKAVAKWKEKNIERFREITRKSARAWYEANREKALAYKASHRAEQAAAARKRRADGCEKDLLRCQERRARKRANGGRLSPGITGKLMQLQRGRCAICEGDLSVVGKHLDHIVPLAAGGVHEDHNIQLLCPSCNHRKGARDPIEYMQSLGRLL